MFVFVGDAEEGKVNSGLFHLLSNGFYFPANGVKGDRSLEDSEDVIAGFDLSGLGDEGVDDVFHLINDVAYVLHHDLDALVVLSLLHGVLEEASQDAEISL